MGLRTTKNFVTQNAVDNIMSVARRPDKTYVDTRRGDKHCLIPSGLEPVYTHKKVNLHIALTDMIRYDTCADRGQFILSITRKRKYKQKKTQKSMRSESSSALWRQSRENQKTMEERICERDDL